MRVAVVAVLLLVAWLLWATLGASAAAPSAPIAPAAAPGTVNVEPARAGVDESRADATGTSTSTAAPTREAVPVASSDDSTPPRTLRGRVRLATGEGVEASVRVGKRTRATAADGTFAVDVRDGDDLLAWCKQYEPVQIASVARFAEGEPLDVVLPGLACTIDGVLVTPDGAACTGWFLDLSGGVLDCGDRGLPKLSVEDYVVGASHADRDGLDTGKPVSGPNGVFPNQCRIGDDGTFRVGGLRRGQVYVLRAWNEQTLQTVRSGPIGAPTSGYRFVVPAGEWRERVRGRVIDRRGAPLAGVQVRLTMRVHVNGGSESYQTGQTVVTTEDGVFVFTRVPCLDLLLRFNGSHVVSLYRELPGTEPADDLVVPLACQGSFRFEPATGAPEPATLRVLDAGGRAMRVSRRTGEGTSEAGERLWLPGKVPGAAIEANDEATWLVLEDENGRELRRIPLLLARGEVRVVRG